MKLHLVSVGKPHDSYVKEGTEMFTKRIAHYFPVQWHIISSTKQVNGNETLQKQKDAEAIFPLIQKDDYLIVLDERGKQMDSMELAAFLQLRANESKKNIFFLIGGAYGVHETLIKRANYTWSLSRLVFPHQLVRLVLSEQLYRACSILKNENYHHE
ncbi:MAG: 23S rRNA (pseudouridine(1915)-N(3))-methyltransferase RlmH [Ferruginibacter sp.]